MKPPSYKINISGGAYLRVELPDSTRVYTLSRLFNINDAGRLVTEQGYPIFEYIDLTPPYTNLLQITLTGEVLELISDVWTHIGQIEAVLFEHPEQLLDLGNGYYSDTVGSGAPLLGDPGGPPPFDTVKTTYNIIFNPPKTYPHAVMLVNPDDCPAVLALAQTVSAALLLNSAIYTDPDPTLDAINAQVAILQNLINEVEGGNHMMKGLRDEASVRLYKMLQDETIYVNLIANGDRGVLELSGFSISDPPNPRPVPEQVVIKRIDDSPHPHTAKIYIENMGQHNLNFSVQITLTPDVESSWKDVLLTGNSHELLIPNRIYGQEVWYRVNASNSNGAGQWSNAVSFISLH